jgi:hypothetical protein
MTPANQPQQVSVERHAPEHGGVLAAAAAPAGCCCCCCCCLHTIGGIAGAIHGAFSHIDERSPFGGPPRDFRRDPDSPVGPYWNRDRPDDIDAPFPFRRDQFEDEKPILPVPLLYWLLVLFLGAATAGGVYLYDGARNPGMLVLGGFIAAMVLPGLQLVASLLTTVVILIFYPDKSYPLTRIGRITLWSFVGALMGILAMAGCIGILYVSSNVR